MQRPLYLLFSAIAFLGCTPQPPSLGLSRNAIINGVPSGSEDDFAVGIGILRNGQFYGACSGVLVAPNLVLTARHCVSGTQSGGIGCSMDGTSFGGGGVFGDYAPSDLGILVGPTIEGDFAAHGMKILHPDVDNLCNSDIAAIVLDQDITNAPFAQLRLSTPPQQGETMTAIGWGVSNNSNGYERRRRSGIPIVEVGPYGDLMGEIGPNEFQIGEGICEGDSGGPAIDDTTRAVLGVVSRGGNNAPPNQNDPAATCVDGNGYAALNIYTRVDGWKDFVLSAFQEAGHDPWEEGGPDPRKAKAGEDCATNDDCRSALCITAGGRSFCSTPCDPADPSTCTDGNTCQDINGQPACAPPPPPSGGCAMAPAPVPGATAAALLILATALLLLGRRRA